MNWLIVNPSSGNAKDSGFWQELLQRKGVVSHTDGDGAISKIPNLREQDCLIVAGGDGTVRRYADWCIANRCSLGVLPAGTGNDFARGIGLPLEPDAACSIIAEGHVRQVDTGQVNNQLFLNVAHVGLGSKIGPEVETSTKRWWGRFAYLRTLIERLRSARGFKATITSNDETFRGRWLQISVANGGSFGGGQRFFEASPFDGQLDLLAIRPRPFSKLFAIWLAARLRGTAPASEAIEQRRGTRFEITGDARLAVIGDGETLTRLPANFEVHPGALRVLLPAD